MIQITDTLTQGIRGRCGEPLFGLYRWCTGESLNGHPERRSLLLEKGQLRDAVKSSGTQSTHISMIHRRSLPSGALSQCVCTKVAIGLWICGRVRIPADRPEQSRVDNLWTAPKSRCKTPALRRRGPQVAHTLGPLAHIPTGPATSYV